MSCSDELGCESSALEARQKKRQAGLDVIDCGSVEYPNVGECRSLTASEQCMLSAIEDCTPARLAATRYTTEGDPIVELVLVGSGDDPCAITQLVDSSADEYRGNYGPRTESACSDLAVQEDDACAYLYPVGCEVVDEW